MNRRGFISLLTGAAGATLVPWRGNVQPLISLPAGYCDDDFSWSGWYPTQNFSNRLVSSSVLNERTLEDLLTTMHQSMLRSVALLPPHLVVSPQVKHLIDTDPIARQAAEMALGKKL